MSYGYEDDYPSHYDPETVRFYDVAHEGAQVRSVAGALPVLEPLSGAQPRSIVVLPTDSVARACAEMVASGNAPATAALAQAAARQPVSVVNALPSYVGALDVVIVMGEAGECDWASRDIITAARRGATTIFVGPGEGPIVEDLPEDTLVIPALPTARGASPARYISALTALIGSLGVGVGGLESTLTGIADAIDAELETLSPQRDATVNPGRELAEFCAGSLVVHSSGPVPYDPQGQVQPDIGGHVARIAAVLWSTHGLVSSAVSSLELPRCIERARSARPASDDLFYDPFIDGESSGNDLVSLRVVLWGQEEANLANAIPVNVTDEVPGMGNLGSALQLITRAYAATAYEST